MMEWLAQHAELLWTGAGGLLVGYLAAVLKTRVETAAQADQQLRATRAEAYKVVWQLTSVLPKWPRRTEATYAEMQRLRESLRDWYFSGAGVYLSRRSFRRYGRLHAALAELSVGDTGELPDAVYDRVRDRCSALRSALTDDLLSRRAGSLWPF